MKLERLNTVIKKKKIFPFEDVPSILLCPQQNVDPFLKKSIKANFYNTCDWMLLKTTC